MQKFNDFEDIYDQYADMLFRLAFSYVRNSQDAKDIVQDVFLRYLKTSRKFHDENHCRSWLIRVTINRCKDMFRSKKNDLPFDEEIFISIDEETCSVFELLNLLPEKYRKVIILHELEGYRIEEAAKMLHLSISAVKMRLLRAKNMLRNEVNKKENDCE